MKVAYLILAYILMMPTCVLAQKDYYYGIAAGINFAKVQGNWAKLTQIENITPDYQTGAQMGFFLDMQISESFSIEPQLKFSQKGVKFENNLTFTETENNILRTIQVYHKLTERFNYLVLPVLVKYRINKFSVFSGLYISKLIKAKLDEEIILEIIETDLLTNNTIQYQESSTGYYSGTNGYNTTDIGYLAGVDYNFPSGIGFEARIENGFLNTFDVPVIKDKFKNNVVYTGVRFRF